MLLAIDQRALPRELSWLRMTTVDDLIDAIKTLAIRGAPALGVAGAFGVALAAYTHMPAMPRRRRCRLSGSRRPDPPR